MRAYAESPLERYSEPPLEFCASPPNTSSYEHYLELPEELCASPPVAGTLGTTTARLHRAGWLDEDITPSPFGIVVPKHISELTENNPTDEPCAFCDPPLDIQEVSTFDFAVPIVSGQIAVKLTLGTMRPAYLLGVTREHTTSFAQLNPDLLAEVDQAFTEIEQRTIARLGLSPFGRKQTYENYVRLEHGSDNVDSCGLGAGACVTHAHQHFIPATGKTADMMLDDAHGIAWQKLDSYQDLAQLRGEPYLYVGHKSSHYAAPNPGVVSQWGRRIIAQEDRHANWDWAVSHGILNLMHSLHALGWQMPPGKMLIRGGTGITKLKKPVGTGASAPAIPSGRV